MLLSFPLMAVIQAVSARIGCVTGNGIAANLRRHYPPWLLYSVVLLLLVANVINLGADLGAMGAALGLLLGGPRQLYAVLFGVLCVLLEVFVSYTRYAAALKWATLSRVHLCGGPVRGKRILGTCAARPLVPAWCSTRRTQWPWSRFSARRSARTLVLAAGQEVEEQRRPHVKALCVTPRDAGPELARIRTDTIFGMGFSNLIAVCIIIATAATLNASGITEIRTSSEAAEACGPSQATFTFALYAAGIIATGLLPFGPRGLCRLCAERGIWLERGPGPAAARGEGVLPDDRNRDGWRHPAELHWPRSHQGSLLERRRQWRACCAADGRHDGDRNELSHHGRLTLPRPMLVGGWLATLLMALVTIGFFIA